MRVKTIVLWGAFLVTAVANAQSDILLQAVGFALTGSDNAKVRVVNRADCIFGIGDQVFRLNNVQADRIAISISRNAYTGDTSVQVDLHGAATIYENIEKGLKGSPSPYVLQLFPDAYKDHHISSNEHTLTLSTSESSRVSRAWQYIYSNGCTGQKSPF
jgi:hypothetical protein